MAELAPGFVAIPREPRTVDHLRQEPDALVAIRSKKSYPIVDGIPVLLPQR